MVVELVVVVAESVDVELVEVVVVEDGEVELDDEVPLAPPMQPASSNAMHATATTRSNIDTATTTPLNCFARLLLDSVRGRH